MELSLEPIGPEDAQDYHDGEDDEIVRWLSGGHATVEEVRGYFGWLSANAEADCGKRALAVRLGGRLAGYLEFDTEIRDGLEADDVNVAYAVFPWARGRGVAGDAGRQLAAHLAERGIGRAALRIDTANVASIRVAEKGGFLLSKEITSTTDVRPDGTATVLRVYRAP